VGQAHLKASAQAAADRRAACLPSRGRVRSSAVFGVLAISAMSGSCKRGPAGPTAGGPSKDQAIAVRDATGFFEESRPRYDWLLKPELEPPSLPPPSQTDITRVISKNGLGIKACYRRARRRDSSLTRGKIVIGVTIAMSGRVKGVRVDGPASFGTLEPCVKEMVFRWAFPPSSDEYATEFSYVFERNE
jgi:hypothetical protein